MVVSWEYAVSSLGFVDFVDDNQLHWPLDVVFNKDGACIRNDNAAENIDILRKWALNVLQKAKQKSGQSIKSLRPRAWGKVPIDLTLGIKDAMIAPWLNLYTCVVTPNFL